MLTALAIKTLPLFQTNYRDNCPGGKQYTFNLCVNGRKVAETEKEKAYLILLKATKRAGVDPLTQQELIPV